MVGIFLIIVMLGLIACSSDEVDDAPLDEASINVYIPQLEERGAKVIWK